MYIYIYICILDISLKDTKWSSKLDLCFYVLVTLTQQTSKIYNRPTKNRSSYKVFNITKNENQPQPQQQQQHAWIQEGHADSPRWR